MTDDTTRLAVLIDADNTTPKLVREMFEELAGYGTLTVKRAYGDWTNDHLKGWRNQLHRHAISPMQQFANTSGKNSTDSALIIDAMDLLYADNVDGFVIVSSDADFTRLATRLRESGKVVYGLGQRKTPQSFVEACDKFIFLEVLGGSGDSETTSSGDDVDDENAPDAGKDSSSGTDGDLHSLMTRSVNKSPQDDDDWTALGSLGNLLNRTDPSFDPRTYGARKLSDLVKQLPYLETRSVKGSSGRSELYVRLKGSGQTRKAPTRKTKGGASAETSKAEPAKSEPAKAETATAEATAPATKAPARRSATRKTAAKKV
jgi:uncharacterized LabA/DUF88 family protein